jgi:hypothetical protein
MKATELFGHNSSNLKMNNWGTSEQVSDLKGHDFSRAAIAAKSTWASAPERMPSNSKDLFRGSLRSTKAGRKK